MPEQVYEFPGYEKSWDLFKLTTDASAERNTVDGVAELRNIYEANKARLRKFFPEDGRLSVQMEGLPFEMSWDEVMRTNRSVISAFAERQSNKPKFAEISQSGYRYAVDWLMVKIQDYGIIDVAKNRTMDGKGPAVSTTIAELIENAGSAWNESLNVQGDYNHYLRHYPAKLKPMVKEFINLIMSEVIARLKPLVNQKLTVVLSINPFDLLITSMHTSNWNSCHNFNGGAHRAGNLAYVGDHVSAVAYAYQEVSAPEWLARGKSPVLYPKKLWRAMVFIDIDNLQGIISRQYPGNQPEISRMARRLLAQVLRTSTADKIAYSWIVRKDRPSMGKSTEEEEERTQVDFKVNGLGWLYVDGATEHLRMRDGGRRMTITVGIKEIPCLDCGDPREDRNTKDIICADCGGEAGDTEDDDDDGFHCQHCQQFVVQEQIHFHDGQPHCLNCLHEHHPELEEAV